MSKMIFDTGEQTGVGPAPHPYKGATSRIRGFYQAIDKVLNHINTIDSSEMTMKEFRSRLYQDIGDMEP